MPPLPHVKRGTKIKVLREGMLARKQAMSDSLGCHVIGVAPPCPDRKHLPTVVAGAVKRYCSELPSMYNKTTWSNVTGMVVLRVSNRRIRRAHLVGLRKFVRSWLRKSGLKRLPSMQFGPREWLETTSYGQARKQDFLDILDDDAYKSGDIRVTSHIKDEFYTDIKHSRHINSADDHFKLRVGPMFHRIEKALFQLEPFIKKIPVPERGKYIYDMLWEEGAVYYASDYTAFETHFTADLMDAVEFELYRYMAPDDVDGRQFLQDIQSLKGWHNCRSELIRVTLHATRMSGEMNTSLGNSFSNLMFMLYACHIQGLHCVGVVEGDDGVFRIRGGKFDETIFQEMGLCIKLQSSSCLSEMSFCGIVQDEDAKQQVTNPYKVLAQFGWSPMRYVGCGSKLRVFLAQSKALSYLYAYPHLPVVRKFCEYVLRTTKHQVYRENDARDRFEMYEVDKIIAAAVAYKEGKIPAFAPEMGTRLLVERLTTQLGQPLTVAQQLQAEQYLDSLTEFGPVFLPFEFPLVYHQVWANYVSDEEHQATWCHFPSQIKEALSFVTSSRVSLLSFSDATRSQLQPE